MSAGFESALREGARRMGLDLPPDGIERLKAHQALLRRWAPKVNLTTVLDDEGMAERLYLDSAVVLTHFGPAARLHDVGSGAGFPGLVLKALQPDLEVTLTEARRKRVSFLKQAAREMDLGEGLSIRWQRLGWEAEGEDRSAEGGPGWQEVISRATFPPEVWLQAGPGLVTPGGRLWIMAGQPHGPGEQPPDLRPPDGFSAEKTLRYQLPFCGLDRWLIGFRRG